MEVELPNEDASKSSTWKELFVEKSERSFYGDEFGFIFIRLL